MDAKEAIMAGQEKIGLNDAQLKDKYLTFWSDNQLFAITIENVVQIIGIQGITPMPEFPYYAKGVIQLRENVIPVIDMRLRLGRNEQTYDERTCIIVTSIHDSLAGLIVDGVDSVTDIDPELISDTPKVGESAEEYLSGIGRLNGEKVVLVVDAARLLSESLGIRG